MSKFGHKFDRESAFIELSSAEVQEVIDRHFPGEKLVSYERLSGGFRNTNYKITLNDRIIVLRIGQENLEDMKKEYALLKVLKHIPTPHPLCEHFEGAKPYYLMSFIEGETLDTIWESLSQNELLDLFKQAGEILARIHQYKFSTAGFFDQSLNIIDPFSNLGETLIEYIISTLKPMQLEGELDNIKNDLITLIEKNRKLLTSLRPTNRLNHCDFNPKNIMVKDGKITAILDWEFAFSGSPLGDLANFLRFEDEMPLESQKFFLEGYGDKNLVKNWRTIAYLLDLAAMVSFMVKRKQKPRSFQTAIEVCRKTLNLFLHESNP